MPLDSHPKNGHLYKRNGNKKGENREKSNKVRKEVKSLGEKYESRQKVTEIDKESRCIKMKSFLSLK